MKEYNIKYDEAVVVLPRDTSEKRRKGIQELEGRLGRPSKAFFTFPYIFLPGCIDYINNKYGNLHITTFDNAIELDLLNIKVHSVHQDCEGLANASFLALKDYLKGKPKAVTVTVKPKVIRR